MVTGTIRSICHGMIAVFALMTSQTLAQQPMTPQLPVSKVITWQPPAAGTVAVGILGEIARPGVYAVDPQGLTLQAVIRRAGGLTDTASGTIRIVRQDRVVESVYFTQSTNTALLANDLLVVESQQARAAVARYFDADPQARPAAPPTIRGTDPTGVQVAFVNILDRPVVVRIKHEQAHLGQVVQMLAQPQELAQAVRVIGPDRGVALGAHVSPTADLSDGSVLVFPRQAVNRTKLPPLPNVYESEIATGAVPSLIGGPSGQSPELRNVGQLPPLMARQMPETLPQVPPPPDAFAPHPSTLPTPTSEPAVPTAPPASSRIEIPPADPAMPLVQSPPRIATLPFAGQPRITSSSQQTLAAEPAPPPPAEELPARTAERPSRKAAPEPDLDLDTSLEEAEPAESPLSIIRMLALFMTVGLLIGVALVTRKVVTRPEPRRNRGVLRIDPARSPAVPAPKSEAFTQAPSVEVPPVESTSVTAAPLAIDPVVAAPAIEEPALDESTAAAENAATAEDVWLDQLLANALPIAEEKPVFPSPIVLQGQIAPPPVFRLDAAEAPLRGPHFAPAGQQASGLEPAKASQEMIDEFDEPHAGRPARPHFLRPRPGERTVAAAAAAAATTSGTTAATNQGRTRSADSPPSATPVADALRHLQGGQS